MEDLFRGFFEMTPWWLGVLVLVGSVYLGNRFPAWAAAVLSAARSGAARALLGRLHPTPPPDEPPDMPPAVLEDTSDMEDPEIKRYRDNGG